MEKFHYDLINDVMDNFDFGKVAHTMKALDWKWALPGGEYEVPDEFTLRKQARELLTETIESSKNDYDGSGVTISTGGFEVYYKEDDKYLELKFVLTSWNSYVDEDGSVMTA